MDIGRSVFGLIGLVVAIILIANVALPTFQDVADNREYFDNSDGSELYQLAAIDDLPVGYTISYNIEEPNVIRSGPDRIEAHSATFLCATDRFDIRFAIGTTAPFIQSTGLTALGYTEVYVSPTSTSTSVDFVFGDGVVTIRQSGVQPYDVDLDTGGFVVVRDGSYVLTASAYVTSTTPIYAMQTIPIKNSQRCIAYVSGDISNPTVSILGATATVSDVQVTTAPVEGQNDVYLVSGLTMDMVIGEDTYDNVSISALIVQETVSIPKDNGLTDSQVLMLSIIPMIMVILPVIMAVRLLGGRD